MQQVFRDHFDAWGRAHTQPLRVLKAASNIRACRSAVLGGHIEKCPDGHVERAHYNSCRHRSCPLCAYIHVERWIGRKLAALPDCDYFHVIFTLDGELNDLWRFNRERFTQIFFAAAWGSLKELLGDPKWLGATPGAIAAFHSWGQTLWIHPHLHFLVTGGGLTPEEVWKPVSRAYLLPAAVLGAKFRGKLRALCRQAMEADELRVPEGLTHQRLLNRLNKLGRKRVHVRIQPPYQHGRGVVAYLGRYLRGGPVSDRRLDYEGREVTLRYKDNRKLDGQGRPRRETMLLSPSEFLRRVSEHVPPKGFHVVRSYGLLAPGNRRKLNALREQLGQLPYESDEQEDTVQEILARCSGGRLRARGCPVCGKPLVTAERIPRARSPPPRSPPA